MNHSAIDERRRRRGKEGERKAEEVSTEMAERSVHSLAYSASAKPSSSSSYLLLPKASETEIQSDRLEMAEIPETTTMATDTKKSREIPTIVVVPNSEEKVQRSLGTRKSARAK